VAAAGAVASGATSYAWSNGSPLVERLTGQPLVEILAQVRSRPCSSSGPYPPRSNGRSTVAAAGAGEREAGQRRHVLHLVERLTAGREAHRAAAGRDPRTGPEPALLIIYGF